MGHTKRRCSTSPCWPQSQSGECITLILFKCSGNDPWFSRSLLMVVIMRLDMWLVLVNHGVVVTCGCTKPYIFPLVNREISHSLCHLSAFSCLNWATRSVRVTCKLRLIPVLAASFASLSTTSLPISPE